MIKQRGDTIVEVLIAVAVLGLVLGSSFAIANRSLTASLQAQERSEATKVIETQLEILRFNAPTVTASGFSAPTGFCFDLAINPPALTNLAASPPASAASDSLAATTYTTHCQVNNGGAATYNIAVTRAGGSTSLFSIQVRWFKAGGRGVEEAKTAYAL